MNINNFYDKLQALCGKEDPRTNFRFTREIATDPTGKTLCLCGQPIKRRFEIQSCETKCKAIVGSTCFKRFLPVAYKEYQLTKAKKCGVCNHTNADLTNFAQIVAAEFSRARVLRIAVI